MNKQKRSRIKAKNLFAFTLSLLMILTSFSGLATTFAAGIDAQSSGITAGESFPVTIDPEGETLTLYLPAGLSLESASPAPQYAPSGGLLIAERTVLTFTAVAGSYNLQLYDAEGNSAGAPVAFTVAENEQMFANPLLMHQ